MTTLPYGPATPEIRRFLVQLAALGASARAQVVERFERAAVTSVFSSADAAVGETIERSARTDARDALGGPLMALMRRTDRPGPGSGTVTDGESGDDALDALDPIAEPALAALLALLVRDLISNEQFTTLYAPFADTIPAE